MKNLLKLLAVLTISTPIITNIVGCGKKEEKRDQSLELLSQEIVKQIVGFNSENNWNLTITKDVKELKVKELIKTAITKKLPLNLQETFKNGLFNIANFYDNKNKILDSSYFLKRQTKTTLTFDFTFNTISDQATINLTVANGIEEQKIIDHINGMVSLDLTMACHFNDGQTKLIELIISTIADTITDKSLKEYFYKNFKVSNILYNNENINDDFFKESSKKVKLQFKYSFVEDINIVDTVDFYLTITINDKIQDTDIIDKINNLNNLNVEMTAISTNGLKQVKNLIRAEIINALSLNCQDQNIKTSFEKGNFVIHSVTVDKTKVDDSYFVEAHLLSKISISYTFGNIVEKQNLNLNLLVKETDERVAETIKKAIPEKYEVNRGTAEDDVKNDLFNIVKNYFATNTEVKDTIVMTFRKDAKKKFKFGDFKRKEDKITVLNHPIYSLEVVYGSFTWKQDIEIIIL